MTIKRLNNPNFPSVFYKHVLAWSIYIAYELLFLFLVGGTLSKVPNYVLNYSLNIGLFYFNAHVLFPFVLERLRGSVILGVLLVAIEIITFTALKYPINALLLDSYDVINGWKEYKIHFVTNGMRSFFIVGFSTGYAFALLTIKRSRQLAILETQKLQEQNEKILLQKDLLSSRNAYLQAQVNPHLLFNTLNFMYNASTKLSEKLAGAIMTLSDIMRYALTNIDADDKVLLEQEIIHINNYIKLNQIRYEEKLNIDFFVIGEPSTLRIIPLALITLVENLFKYGDLLDPMQPAVISLIIKGQKLELSLVNKKRANRRVHSHGTGIANLNERLEAYYPGAYFLGIQDCENRYALNLKLTLNE